METERIIRLPRKLKKRIKNFIGPGSLNGIMEGSLYIERKYKGKGVVTRRSEWYYNKIKNGSKNYYEGGASNPYLMIPLVKFPFNINSLRTIKIKKILNGKK